MLRTLLTAMLGLAVVAPPLSAAPAVSNGAYRMGADVLWSHGLLGGGETVAVLDEGFGGLGESIAAGELPPLESMTVRSFDAPYGLAGRTDIGVATEHGVRMAEIVHDIAPGARLALVNYHTEQEFRDATDWIIQQGIPVVSHSNSFLNPPYDGSGANAQAVDRAVASGVFWVNSAGNFAQRHWAGTASETGTVIPLNIPAGEIMAYTLARFGAPADAVALSLERRTNGGDWQVASAVEARGSGASTDIVSSFGEEWRIVLTQTEGGPSTLRLFSRTAGFGPIASPDGSIPTPGDAAGAFTVGAVSWTGETLEPYSSRGPTQDGRVKPDVVGPTYVTSNPAWPGTAGTSAATAHVAGAAALVRELRRARGQPATPADLRAHLIAGVLDLGAPGPDPGYGAGMVRLDTTRPRVSLAVGAGSRPIVSAQALDEGSIGRLAVSVDGRALRDVRAAQIVLRLPRLAAGRHRLTVSATDVAGNTAGAGRWVRIR